MSEWEASWEAEEVVSSVLEELIGGAEEQVREKALTKAVVPFTVEALSAKISETMAWLDANLNAEKEEYERVQQELEAVVNPVLQQAAGGNNLTCRGHFHEKKRRLKN